MHAVATEAKRDHLTFLVAGPLHNRVARVPYDMHGQLPFLVDLPTEDGGTAAYRLTSTGTYRWACETLPASTFESAQAREEFTDGARVLHDSPNSAG